eukprot:CAMPEP_0116891824 /NCGR_PEP_ID=MMETSP0467-20121206/2164_1 /TAXON_ID=283647 /ORGANISM="Mesodinium pulex, Strain SPMC105" /LENGTH=62 /DNA_ID=CAMNT_0004560573 /DNA_START=229 /DNA_END=417 /DNA_ORIENTATION=-
MEKFLDDEIEENQESECKYMATNAVKHLAHLKHYSKYDYETLSFAILKHIMLTPMDEYEKIL